MSIYPQLDTRVIIAHSAQQIPNLSLKVITHTNTVLNFHNYVQNKEEKNKIQRERKVERLYQVRSFVHLSYYLLRMVLREVEGASATPSKLKIQGSYSDAVKARRSLSNT